MGLETNTGLLMQIEKQTNGKDRVKVTINNRTVNRTAKAGKDRLNKLNKQCQNQNRVQR